MFEKIAISGFRRLQNVYLDLKPLNVLIGANGSGKTSLLDVFSLLAGSASGKLDDTMSDLGGIDANLTNLSAERGAKARIMAFKLDMPVVGYNPVEYQVTIGPQGVTYQIVDETLVQRKGKPKPMSPQERAALSRMSYGERAARYMMSKKTMKHIDAHHGDVRYYEQDKRALKAPTWDFNSHETALSQVPKMFQEPENFRKDLASSTHYHVLDVSRQAPVRRPQQMRDAQLPGRDGEDLVSCLFTLQQTDPDCFETIEAALRAAFPGFERLNFPPVAAGTLAMTWKEKTSKHPFYMHQLSEGTLRFLWLVTLLHSPGLSAITMIDEPEVSLHPELLSLLADLMREASRRTQLIVATHADRLIRFLKPAEIVTINVNEDGGAEFTRADELDLEKWLEEYTLDEVWRMGRIGARP